MAVRTPLTRRRMAASVLVSALAGTALVTSRPSHSASSTHNAPYDFSDPYDSLAAYAKVRARLDGKPAAYWYYSHGIAQPAGAPPKLLYAYEGVSFQQVRIREDRTLSAVFADCSYVLDPDTREVLDRFTNPYTGAVNTPRHQAAMVSPALHITPEQAINTAFSWPEGVFRDMRVRPPVISGDTIWFNDDVLFFKPANLEGDNLPAFLPKGEMAQTELVTYRALLSDVQNPDLVSAPATYAINANIPWKGWMEMGDRPGGILTRYIGRKLESIDEIPERLRARINQDYPDYLTNPGL